MKTHWTSPRVADFMGEICMALRSGAEHCALVLPRWRQESFIAAFRRYAESSLNFIYIVRLQPGSNLLDSLRPVFCDDENGVDDILSLAHCHTRQAAIPIILMPDGDENLKRAIRDFARAMRANAKACMNMREALNWKMLFVVEPLEDFPQEDVGLKYFHWWGRLQASDLEYAIEQELMDKNLGQEAWLWYYSLCRGLCEGALELASMIWECSPTSMAEIKKMLAAHPLHNENAGRLALQYWREPGPLPNRHGLPIALARQAWNAGILEIGCRGKPLLHPAALLAAGLDDALENQVLAGQIQVYFPLVQEVIHLLHRRLDAIYGQSWQEKTGNIDEIGPLQRLFYDLGSRSRGFAREAELAFLWWKIRNALAHHVMLDARLAIKAVSLYERMREESGQ